MTLRARAWVPGRAPSAVASAVYTLQPVSPTIAPVTGTYSAAQTVVLSTATPSALIRYTVDGNDPSAASPLYAAPLAVDTSTVVKARAFRTNWAPSAAASATLTFNYGVLAAPVSSHGGGSYNQAQTVSLTAAAGATIRYTLDGSDPTESSSAYSAPLTIGESTTLKARAYKPDWTPSPILTEVYTLDVTPPTIVAKVWPTPTASGWNNTDVTVTFLCHDTAGPITCPASVAVTQDGAGQIVTRSVTDAAGNQAEASVTINIDRTPPGVAIASPANGTTTSATSVAVTGTVSDAASGIVSATCNGVAATVVDGEVSCLVTLERGRNSIVLHARDAAGNALSAGVRITRAGTPTVLRVTPGTRTLLADESHSLRVADEFGISAVTPAWMSSDPAVLTVDADGIVTAVSPGTVTVTATSQGLSAEATLTVVGGSALPVGAMRWTVAPVAGLTMAAPMYTHRVDPEGPDLFAVEGGGAGQPTVLRALTASGEQLWTETVAGMPVMGDSFGGVVAELRDSSGDSRGLARVGGPATAPPWRYESSGFVWEAAQAPDGTIYAIEWLPGVDSNGAAMWDRFAVAIDGSTGRLTARHPLARDVFAHQPSDPACQPSRFDYAPEVVTPIVGTDGHGYFQVRQLTRTTRGGCSAGFEDDATVDNTLTLLALSPTGATTTVTLYRFQREGAGTTWCDRTPLVGEVIPDGLGGVLATWGSFDGANCSNTYEGKVTRVDRDGTRHPFDHGDTQILMTGDQGTAYLGGSTPGNVTAVDIATWATKWTIEGFNTPRMALPDGGVALWDPLSGTLRAVNSMGVVNPMVALPITDPLQVGVEWWIGTSSGFLRSVAGPR
jgi:hypothetical protein